MQLMLLHLMVCKSVTVLQPGPGISDMLLTCDLPRTCILSISLCRKCSCRRQSCICLQARNRHSAQDPVTGSHGPLHGCAGAQNFRLILRSAQMIIKASIGSQAEDIIW